MAVTISSFGKFSDGRQVNLYTMENKNGMRVSVANIGAALVRVEVPDRQGRREDVVLGFDSAEEYLQNGCFFGVVIGPNANRIGKASFCLDGVNYPLSVNDGVNNLHSDRNLGWHKCFWEADSGEDSVTFRLADKPDNMGFPGAKKAEITYSLNDENELRLHYHASSDKRTVLNLTNHSYFNLEGHGSGSIEGHELWLGASRYTPADQGSIPTGEIVSVKDTPMDFTVAKRVGKEIDADFEQLQFAGGYDHNWVIDGWDQTLRHFATVKAPVSGRFMEAYTTLPGVQFYAGNFIEQEKGKGQAVYRRRGGLCLETQYFPDSVHQAAFPSCIFGGEKEYDSLTVYRFGAE